MRKIAVLQKTAWGIVVKWRFLFFVVFLAAWAAAMAGLKWRLEKSQQRCRSTTKLLYMPRQAVGIRNLDDRQLLRVLDRNSVRRRVKELVVLPPGEEFTLVSDLKLVQEHRPSSLFVLTAWSGSTAAAVEKVNAFAELLMDTYAEYRTEELNRWKADVDFHREELLGQVADLEVQAAALMEAVGSPSPLEESFALNARLSDLRKNLLMLDVEKTEEEAKRVRFQNELGDVGTTILSCAPKLRKISESIDALDAEIAKMRAKGYTDLNPLVALQLSDRKDLEAQYRQVLQENGVEEATLEDVLRMEKAAAGLLEAQTRLESLEQNRADLLLSISELEARSQELMTVTPELERTEARKAEIEKALARTEEEIGEIRRLLAAVRSDFRQIEPALGAEQTQAMSTANLLKAAAIALAATLAFMAWTVVTGLLFGRVRGAAELGYSGDIRVLGSLPRRWAVRRKTEKGVLEVVSLNFTDAKAPKGAVLVCRLKGAKPQPKFFAELLEMMSQAGMPPFRIHAGEEVPDYPESELERLRIIVKRGEEAWCPVANRYAFSPVELEALRYDLATVRRDFACIFVTMPDGLRRGGNYLRQLLDLCDSALLVVGANKTPRRELAYVRRLALAAGKPMLGVVSGASRGVVQKELEESLW